MTKLLFRLWITPTILGLIGTVAALMIGLLNGLGMGLVVFGGMLALSYWSFHACYKGIYKETARISSLFLWASETDVTHFDSSSEEYRIEESGSSGDMWQGKALILCRAYARDWTIQEMIALLEDLKAKGSGSARNPDNG